MDLADWSTRFERLREPRSILPLNYEADLTSMKTYYESFVQPEEWDDLHWVERCKWVQYYKNAKLFVNETPISENMKRMIQECLEDPAESVADIEFHFSSIGRPKLFSFSQEDELISCRAVIKVPLPEAGHVLFDAYDTLTAKNYFQLLFWSCDEFNSTEPSLHNIYHEDGEAVNEEFIKTLWDDVDPESDPEEDEEDQDMSDN
jgi:hypothetical protein